MKFRILLVHVLALLIVCATSAASACEVRCATMTGQCHAISQSTDRAVMAGMACAQVKSPSDARLSGRETASMQSGHVASNPSCGMTHFVTQTAVATPDAHKSGVHLRTTAGGTCLAMPATIASLRVGLTRAAAVTLHHLPSLYKTSLRV
jgi:hypothetical protein